MQIAKVYDAASVIDALSAFVAENQIKIRELLQVHNHELNSRSMWERSSRTYVSDELDMLREKQGRYRNNLEVLSGLPRSMAINLSMDEMRDLYPFLPKEH